MQERKGENMKVLMISMPWASLHRPSLALGVLTSSAKQCRFKHEVGQLYGNIRWIEYLMNETNGAISTKEYADIADGYFIGAGEWVFTNALYETDTWKVSEFSLFAQEQGLEPTSLIKMHELSPKFISLLAEEVSLTDYDIIGFTTSFLQNVPSMALAKKIKELAPSKLIAFGGANCDGIQGVTLHKNFPFVDYVIRGEGEEAFKSLLDALESNSSLANIGGLCWRENNFSDPIVNTAPSSPVNMNMVPAPDYKDFFNVFALSQISRWIEPELILEASRGCWWGTKHQCTFCGLNGTFIEYRSKKPDTFLKEIEDVVKKYRVLDISLADNILDMKYFTTLLPKIAELDWDLRMFVEIKANISTDQVHLLSKSGFVEVQPGIENLSSDVLHLMKKGVQGVQNIRLLRDCKTESINVAWNYLHGLPNENEESYRNAINQFPALVHLDPPSGATPVALERFSPYFNSPHLGMENLGPANIYSYIYNLPIKELNNLVYLFESKECGIKGEVLNYLRSKINLWKKYHNGSSLFYRIDDGNIILSDRRNKWPKRDIFIKSGGKAEAYLLLMHGYTISSLQKLLKQKHSLEIDLSELKTYLESWIKDGLIFTDSESYVSLATKRGSINNVIFEKSEVIV